MNTNVNNLTLEVASLKKENNDIKLKITSLEKVNMTEKLQIISKIGGIILTDLEKLLSDVEGAIKKIVMKLISLVNYMCDDVIEKNNVDENKLKYCINLYSQEAK